MITQHENTDMTVALTNNQPTNEQAKTTLAMTQALQLSTNSANSA